MPVLPLAIDIAARAGGNWVRVVHAHRGVAAAPSTALSMA